MAAPLRDLGTLGALLSATWDMLLEGAEDEKARRKMEQQVFRPRVKRRAANTPRREISQAARRAQSDMLAGMVGDDE